MSIKRLNLSEDRVFDNLMAYLERHPDKFQVGISATYGTTIVIADWEDEGLEALESFINAYYTLKGIETGYDYEYNSCDNCGKLICINQGYVTFDDGTNVCEECAEECIPQIIEERMNHEDRAWYQFLNTQHLADAGFSPCENCEDKEWGMHPGMHDTPQAVIKAFNKANELHHINDAYDYIFVVNGSNPFMINFSMWVRRIE